MGIHRITDCSTVLLSTKVICRKLIWFAANYQGCLDHAFVSMAIFFVNANGQWERCQGSCQRFPQIQDVHVRSCCPSPGHGVQSKAAGGPVGSWGATSVLRKLRSRRQVRAQHGFNYDSDCDTIASICVSHQFGADFTFDNNWSYDAYKLEPQHSWHQTTPRIVLYMKKSSKYWSEAHWHKIVR